MKAIKTNIDDIIIGDRIFQYDGVFIEILDIKDDKYKVIPYVCAGGWWDRVQRYCDVEPYWLTREEIIAGLNYSNPKTFHYDRYLLGQKNYYEVRASNKNLNPCDEIIKNNLKSSIRHILSSEQYNQIMDVFSDGTEPLVKNYKLFANRLINCLNRAHIITMDQLLDLTFEDLQNIRGLGIGGIHHMMKKLGIVNNN